MPDPALAQKPDLRCTMGVEGLDSILCGGLPSNRLYLLKGDPGVGKTTLAMQFLLEGVRLGETVLYIALSETRDEIELVARSHGWDLSKVHLFELSALEMQLRGETESTFFHPSEVELNRITEALLKEIERVKPARLVFDSLSELRMLVDTPLRYRRQILRLKQFFAGGNCTVLLLDDHSSGHHDLQVESIAHGVLALEKVLPEYGIARRQLNVVKIRGSKFREGHHDVVMRTGGMHVFPRLVAGEHHQDFERENFPSGIKELDLLLGGGLGRGTSNMLMGPPGTGKSSLTIKFGLEAAQHGEKVAFFLFDESIGTLLDRARQLGMDLRAHRESGMITFQQVDPAEISPGELAHTIQRLVEKEGCRMIVIDSINGYLNAMPGERYLTLQLHEMFAFLNQLGVITVMVLAQQGLIGNMQASVDLTYLADTVILMRYYEARGEMRQAISVVKKRSGEHERAIREIKVSNGEICVGAPLREMQGILTGVPTFERDSSAPERKTG